MCDCVLMLSAEVQPVTGRRSFPWMKGTLTSALYHKSVSFQLVMYIICSKHPNELMSS